MAFVQKQISTGEILNGALEQIGANKRVIAAFLILFIPLTAIANFLDNDVESVALSFNNGPFGIAALVGNVVGQYFLIEAMLFHGRSQNPSRGVRIVMFVGLAIISTIGVSVATVFLIFPGIFLASRWLMCVCFFIGEDQGVIGSLGTSFDRTRGNTLPVALSLLVVLVAAAVGARVLNALSVSAAGFSGSQLGYGMQSLFDALLSEIWSVLIIAMSVATHGPLGGRTETITEVFE